MEVLGKFYGVVMVMIQERIPEPEGEDKGGLLLHAIKEWGAWDEAMTKDNRVLTSQQGYEGTFIEVDLYAVIKFKGLHIWEVSRSGYTTIIYFYYPTDIAVIENEKEVLPPLDPGGPPRPSIVISELNSLEVPLEAGPWADKSVMVC